MLVSIIIPTYNRSALLAEAIQSAVDQTYRPIECIVVDDGSTDNTKEVVNRFIEKNNESFIITYLHQQNAGAQVARNTGTSAATGEFIQYLDSDDILYRDKIKTQVNYFMHHPGCDAVFGDWEKGTIDKKEKVIAYKSDDLIAQFLTDKCIANFAILMRSSFTKKIGDWDVTIKRNQEIDFHLRGVLAGGNFEYQSLLCGLWQTHQGERIANKNTLHATINFYQKWENILSEKKLITNNIKQGIANNYFWFLNEYTGANYNDMTAIIKEIHRLTPENPIFSSFKFIALKKTIGFENAVKAWIYRYKQMKAHNTHTVAG